MFFATNRRMQECAQRIIVYKFLHAALTDNIIKLVAPLHQLSALNGQKITGYCHGYCVVWEKLIKQNIQQEFNFQWSDLYADKNCEYFIKLDEQVKLYQKNQHKNYRGSKYCAGNSVFRQLSQYFSVSEFQPGTMYIIDFAEMPSVGQFFFKNNPHYIRKWHEARLYIDDQHFFHWFDANIGWLKSTQSNPNIATFFAKIAQIFSIFNYQQRFQFIHCEEKWQYSYENAGLP